MALYDRVRAVTYTTGTGALTMGSGVAGYRDFSAVNDGDTVPYVIEDGTNWEIGNGVWTASLARLTRSVLRSSADGAPLTLTGRAQCFISPGQDYFAGIGPNNNYLLKSLSNPDATDDQKAAFVEYLGLPGVVKAQPQAQHFWARIRANVTDVNYLVGGDSTGDAENEHVYLTFVALSAQVSTHTFVYHSWNDATQAWNAPETVSTGSGSNTIHCWNASVSGTLGFYLEAPRHNKIFQQIEYDLVIFSYGHNYGTTTTELQNKAAMLGQIASIMELAPGAGVLLTLQNPRKDTGGPAETAMMVSTLTHVAEQLGCGLIDVYHAFINNPAFNIPAGQAGSLYLDDGTGTHPSAAGSLVWSQAELAALAEPAYYVAYAAQQPGPLTRPVPNFAPNPLFADWGPQDSFPAGWQFNNVTASRDVSRADGSGYCLRLTNTGTSPRMFCDLAGLIPKQGPRLITLLAKMWKPSGFAVPAGTPLAGRVDLTWTDGITAAGATSYPRPMAAPGENSVDGWVYVMTNLLVPDKAPSVVASIYIGEDDGSDTGNNISLDWVIAFLGPVPGSLDYDSQPPRIIDQFYSAENVIKPPTQTGTLVASGATITVAGAQLGGSNAYISMAGLIAGEAYHVKYNLVSTSSGDNNGTTDLRDGSVNGATLVTGIFLDGGLTFTAQSASAALIARAGSANTGWVMNQWAITALDSGIVNPLPVPLTSGRNPDGTTVNATGGAGLFSVSSTPGTSLVLNGEAPQSNTKTDKVQFEAVLPGDYRAGRPLKVRVNGFYAGTGTAGTKTLTVQAYKMSDAGAAGSNLGPAAQTLTNAAANLDFVIDGTTLLPGSRLVVVLTSVLQETGGSASIAARLGLVELL